tara:strand:+ start:375 stop:554 length:180 start_codon:yes stop_codon:yes gene_type:complete
MAGLEVLVEKLNWGMVGILILNALIWYSVFTNGFFTTLIWVVIGAAIIGIIIKLKEMRV